MQNQISVDVAAERIRACAFWVMIFVMSFSESFLMTDARLLTPALLHSCTDLMHVVTALLLCLKGAHDSEKTLVPTRLDILSCPDTPATAWAAR